LPVFPKPALICFGISKNGSHSRLKSVFIPRIEKGTVMNLTSAGEKAPAKPAPAWLRRSLLCLLSGSAVIGAAFVVFLLKPPVKSGPSSFEQQFLSKPSTSRSSPGLIEKAALERRNSADSIICQGTLVGKNGKALAIINGQTVSSGMTIDGAKILKIDSSYVVVECAGKKHRLEPGESFTPAKK